QLNRWQNTYSEQDLKFGTLGILKNKCFLIDTTGVLTSTNITCSSVPDWLTDPDIRVRAGYDNNVQTKEFTKIIPDGLLTAGSSVQYFFRQQDVVPDDPTVFVMCPDTCRIFPQPNEGASFDAHRWQQFSILPDRWKDAAYGGTAAACMLALDYNDRRGDERAFISLADSNGMIKGPKHGAHNGWYCTGAYLASDGTHDYTRENVGALGQYDAIGGMGAGKITIWKHGGEPGSTFDFYQVKAAESSNTGAGGIGARLSNRAGMGLAAGKFGRQAPTPEMLRVYYKLIFLMTGDLNTSILGPVTDRGSDDVAILEDFLSYGADYLHPRGLWVMGDGFVESESNDPYHASFVTDYLACSLRDPSYYALSGSSVLFPDLVSSSVISSRNHIFTAQNSCIWTNDVLNVNAAIPGATVQLYYEYTPSNGPYIAGTFAPSSASHPYVTLMDGYDLMHLRARLGNSSVGRQVYFMDVLVNTFGSVCPFTPAPSLDAPFNTVENVNFLDNVWGNPMRAGGSAVVSFSLAKKDRVEIKVYDVTGRQVRTLADRTFEAGPQQVRWDGTNDQGQRVARGVYFTQVKYIGSRFVDAKKVTVLK
ncbi:MAG TPA: FlgD immunoglobulin-like domain containing protein, partial [Terriglobales bacterium]|nr:FlgD immunoglobulin-like domain containing protein [Terriglobales bacterium]